MAFKLETVPDRFSSMRNLCTPGASCGGLSKIFLRDGNPARCRQRFPLWPSPERPGLCVDLCKIELFFGKPWIEFFQFFDGVAAATRLATS
jgi:hypothetical protein